MARGYYLVKINRYESPAHINYSSEHISGGYFVYKQLLMEGFCYPFGTFHANKTVKNSENPIFRGVLMREGAYIFCSILIILDLYKRVYV